MLARVNPVSAKRPTFAGQPRCDDLASLDADIAIIGIPYRSPYSYIAEVPQLKTVESREESIPSAAEAIRQQSVRWDGYLHHYDFDFGGEPLAGRKIRIVDCGDVVMLPDRDEENKQAATAAIKTILDRGAVPIVIGGDHGTTIPVLRAYENHGPLCIVQIDAHIDFRNEVDGFREGFSNPMRRVSEMPWVKGMAQIGLRGIGSARQGEVDDALSYGSIMIRAEELHQVGVDAALQRIPTADRYHISIDADGLDPSIAPGVAYPSPGGVTYYESLNLMRGLAQKGKIVGLDFDEIHPILDVANLTSICAGHLIVNLIGVLAHQGQIGSS